MVEPDSCNGNKLPVDKQLGDLRQLSADRVHDPAVVGLHGQGLGSSPVSIPMPVSFEATNPEHSILRNDSRGCMDVTRWGGVAADHANKLS